MSLNIKWYVVEEAERNEIARADETMVGRAMFAAVDRKVEELRADYEAHPRINTERVEDDIRFKLGKLSGVKWLAELQAEARKAAAK